MCQKGDVMSGRPASLGYILKGAVHKRIEALINGQPDERKKLLAVLQDWTQDYVDILMQYTRLTPSEGAYLRRTWYNPGQDGWWAAHQPIEPIVRQSLIKALTLAMERNLPVDSYWLSVGDDFQAIVTCSDHQVTRVIITPPTPADAQVDLTKPTVETPIWTIKRGSPWEKIETHDETRHIITSRMKGLP
jgi:hypothetical protein